MHVPHWQVVKRILCYLASNIYHGIMFHPHSSSSILFFSDVDWVVDVDDSPLPGIVSTLVPISFPSPLTSKKLSHSNTEIEYRAIIVVMAEILRLKSLLRELHMHTSTPQVFSDNLGDVLLSVNPVMHSKSIHFELDLHFVGDHIQQHHVKLFHIPTHYQVANLSQSQYLAPVLSC